MFIYGTVYCCTYTVYTPNWNHLGIDRKSISMFHSFCVILRLSIAFQSPHQFAHVAFGYFEIRIRFDSQTALKSILNIWCTHFVLCAPIEWRCFWTFYLISFVPFIIPAAECSVFSTIGNWEWQSEKILHDARFFSFVLWIFLFLTENSIEFCIAFEKWDPVPLGYIGLLNNQP